MSRKCSICKKPEARFKSGLKAYCSPECGTKLALELKAKNDKEIEKFDFFLKADFFL